MNEVSDKDADRSPDDVGQNADSNQTINETSEFNTFNKEGGTGNSTMEISENEHAEQSIDQESGTSAASAKAPTLESLKEKLAKAEEKASRHWDELLRAKAELENARRRAERDVENAHKFAIERFAQELIPVIDSMEMGISAAKEQNADLEKFTEGAELTLKMFLDCTQKFGIEVVNPINESFNPELHQAMSMQESAEHSPNTVITVMQKGYTLQGRLLRPAMVVVAKAVSSNSETSTAENDESEKESTNLDEKA